MAPRRGVTLLELILVMVIVAVGGGLALPRLQRSIENREAKAALQTLRTIANAVRLYELDAGVGLPTIPDLTVTDASNPLVFKGYVKPNEFARGFNYAFTTGNPWFVTAAHQRNSSRILRLRQNPASPANTQSDVVCDTVGFLTGVPAASCP